MRILRWINFSLVTLLLFLTATGWIASKFRFWSFYYVNDSMHVNIWGGNGLFGFSTRSGSIWHMTRSFSFVGTSYGSESSELTPDLISFYDRFAPLGFAHHSRFAGVHDFIVPFWFLTLALAGVETIVVWRILRARRLAAAPAFPVERSDAAQSHEGAK